MVRGDFKVVTHPDRQPAVDFITRSAQGPFIDTGVDVLMRTQPGNPPVTERVYLAKDTVIQLASLLEVAGTSLPSEGQVAHWIAQGKLEGMREGLGDDLADVARTLGRWLDDAGVAREPVSGGVGL